VEVSTDGGGMWHEATLTPPLSSQSWVLWSWPWMAVAPGPQTLTVRATDGTGAMQTAQKRGTVPEGATGYHQVRVVVR
jgi:cytochrome c-type biogenesis protein CcmH/NrfF